MVCGYIKLRCKLPPELNKTFSDQPVCVFCMFGDRGNEYHYTLSDHNISVPLCAAICPVRPAISLDCDVRHLLRASFWCHRRNKLPRKWWRVYCIRNLSWVRTCWCSPYIFVAIDWKRVRNYDLIISFNNELMSWFGVHLIKSRRLGGEGGGGGGRRIHLHVSAFLNGAISIAT